MGNKEKLVYSDDFSVDKDMYVFEGRGTYQIGSGELVLEDTTQTNRSGLTLWLKKRFSGNLRIRYEAEVMEPFIAGNINLFMMASTLNGSNIWQEQHTGSYAEYHKTCNMYIFTHTYQWSRLRKNPGFNILSEDKEMQTKVNQNYQYEFILYNGKIECWVNGRQVHQFMDENPYREGSVGFRTWSTKCKIRNFKIFESTR